MDFEIRADGSLHIEGYVNAVERDSRTVICPECGKCVEQIASGAFGKALRAAPDVAMLVNHDRRRKIGSTAEKNLKLHEDSIGLRASADITDSEVIEKAQRGLLRGWSFGFRAKDTVIERRGENLPRRRVKALDIFEVSIIDDRFTPCYAGTSIEVRADGEEMIETRFNPYHDPNDGKFTSAAGGNLNFVYAGKGTKGQNHDVETAFNRMKIARQQQDFWNDVVEKNAENRDKYIAEKMLEYGAENSNAKMLAEKDFEANYGKTFAADKAERNRWNKAVEQLNKEAENASRKEHLELKQQYYDLIKGKKGAADEKYFMNMFEPSDALLKKRIEQAKSSNRAEPAVNAEYVVRYNKAVLDGYRIRAALLDVP
ncbi:MAG: HK97 family phage prohead protease, partial [Ruminococcus sp.]|nr:HK97 family phage prohead protease [Ruminococcus sp.]